MTAGKAAAAAYATLAVIAAVAFTAWRSIPDWLGWVMAAATIALAFTAPVCLAQWFMGRRR